MLPVTIGLRKEMLPLYYRGVNGVPALAPVAHLVVQSLYAAGIRDVTMVAGRDVESLIRYFTPDRDLIARHAHHKERLVETIALHEMLSKIHFTWVIQSSPSGFGNALLESEATVGRDDFLLHAADALLLQPQPGGIPHLMTRLKEREGASAVVLVRHLKDPRRYGVVEGQTAGRFGKHRFLRVRGMEEKPAAPKSHWAATAIYAFDGSIFRSLKEIDRGGKELEVTSGISHLIETGHKVLAVVCEPAEERWISVGSPQGYFDSLRSSYEHSLEGQGPERAGLPAPTKRSSPA